MRHRVEGRKLKRTASHRKALLRALTTSLLRHKRITTTEAKAKETRRFAEAVITRAKRAFLAEKGGAAVDVHARRMVAVDINDPLVVRELFSEIAPKVAERPGGYTRVVKSFTRIGDGARMAILELVDYNVEQDASAVRSRAKQTMSRAERVARSRAKQAGADTKKPAPAEQPAAAAPVEEPVVEETLTNEEAVDVNAGTAEETPAATDVETGAEGTSEGPTDAATEGEEPPKA